jgi:hypothetical protein
MTREEQNRLIVACIARLAGVLERLSIRYATLLKQADKEYADEAFNAIRENLAILTQKAGLK